MNFPKCLKRALHTVDIINWDKCMEYRKNVLVNLFQGRHKELEAENGSVDMGEGKQRVG